MTTDRDLVERLSAENAELREEVVRLTIDCPGDRLVAREVERMGSTQAVAQSIKGTEAIISKALVEHYKARAERAEAALQRIESISDRVVNAEHYTAKYAIDDLSKIRAIIAQHKNSAYDKGNGG